MTGKEIALALRWLDQHRKIISVASDKALQERQYRDLQVCCDLLRVLGVTPVYNRLLGCYQSNLEKGVVQDDFPI